MKSFRMTCGQFAAMAAFFGRTTRLSPFNLICDVEADSTSSLKGYGFLDDEDQPLEAYGTIFSVLATPDLFFSIAMGESGTGGVASFYADTARDSDFMVSCVPQADNSFDIGYGKSREELSKWAASFAPEENSDLVVYCDTFDFDGAIAMTSMVDLVRGSSTSLEDFSFRAEQFSDFLDEMAIGRTDTFAGALASMTYPKIPELGGGELTACLDSLVAKSILTWDADLGLYSVADNWIRNFYLFYEMVPRYFSIHAQSLGEEGMVSGSVTVLGANGNYIVVEPHPAVEGRAIAAMVGGSVARDMLQGILSDPMKWLSLPGRGMGKVEFEQ